MPPIRKPSARLHVRADVPAMTGSPHNKKFGSKSAKKPATHLHAFQNVRVFAAALDADASPLVILFNALLENDLREDNGKIEQLPKDSLVIVQSLLVHGVVRNISTLKVVVEEFAQRLFKVCTSSSVISSWRSLHTMSALRSEDTVGRFRTIVDMKRNHVANNWAKHYVGTALRPQFAFYWTVRVCDRSTRSCDG